MTQHTPPDGRRRAWLGAVATAMLIAACAPDLRPTPGDDGGTPDAAPQPTGSVTIDATRSDTWVFFDLERGAVVSAPAAPATSRDWDFAFQRFKVMSNGGSSGGGGVEVARVTGVAFDALTEAPAEGWNRDAPDGDDANADPDYAFNVGDGWYSYNVETHYLTPRDVVYVVRSVEGNYFKLQFVRYYDAAGTSGFITFRLAPVAPPRATRPADEFTVAAAAGDAWAYVSLATRTVVNVADPATSHAWDLAFSRTRVRTNGGTSGPGRGGARLAPEGATYATLAESPTGGFAVDALVPNPGPPGSGEASGNAALGNWYNYDPATHAVSPRDAAFLVRTAAGAFAKVQVVRYADGTYTLRAAPVARRVATQSTRVVAADGAQWVYLDLRAGQTVTVADPATSHAWDLAFSRTRVRTNSGTSGPAAGGALEAPTPRLGEITAAPATGYVVDALVPNPGPPGSGEASGNAALGNWFNYDPATHAVSPRDAAFLVRTVDGGFAKLRVAAYADGAYTLEWAYTGPGETGF